MVAIAKLCIRPNDTWKGRSIKLSHYVDLSKRYLGVMPNDLHLFVRTMADVPMTMKEEFTKILGSTRLERNSNSGPNITSENGPKNEGVNGG